MITSLRCVDVNINIFIYNLKKCKLKTKSYSDDDIKSMIDMATH